ncbi:MAG TPA: TfoX/Sxy family protein [Acetobacteraceae bacterium]|nr:TfoX/Sxy family protein [Acetobacteraceae bacterium]
MAVSPGFQAYVLDLLAPLGPVARRMFGGVGIMRDGVMFALLARDALYLRVDETTRARFEEAGCTPFTYDRAGREVSIASYWSVPDALFDEPEALVEWARQALDAARRGGPARRADKQRQASRLVMSPKRAARRSRR